MEKVLKPSNIDITIKVTQNTHKLLSKSLAMTQIISNALITPQSLDSNIIRTFLRSLANMRVLFKNIVKLAEYKPIANTELIKVQPQETQQTSPKSSTNCLLEKTEIYSSNGPINCTTRTPTGISSNQQGQETPLRGKPPCSLLNECERKSLGVPKGSEAGEPNIRIGAGGSKEVLTRAIKMKADLKTNPKDQTQNEKGVLGPSERNKTEHHLKHKSPFSNNFQPIKSEDFLKMVLGEYVRPQKMEKSMKMSQSEEKTATAKVTGSITQGMEKPIKMGQYKEKTAEAMGNFQSETKLSRREKKKQKVNNPMKG